MMPDIAENICMVFTIQQKRGCSLNRHPLSFCYLYHRGSLTIIINKCTQLELEHQTSLKHVEILVILEFITVKTIVCVAQHHLGKLIERVVYTQSSGMHITATYT